ncbi:MarR family winged helix-turn-helix transcriptional regulator [Paenibacillus sp. MBLB4367]|uniref:MarR family winged helix-turn-helix transcriptional regulator n=1 Tax=Paenibacillus sp. MBLB4367 TaxID=3384767 RepID=UPI00390817C1
MKAEKLQQWIERYTESSFTVNKRLNATIREKIGGDLTLEQLSILHYIDARDTCTSTELADTFCVGKSAITAIITRLENKGLLERLRDSKDRRIVYLRPTEAGRSMHKVGEDGIQKVLSPYLIHFTEHEIETFITSFEKLAALMVKDGGKA